MSRIILDEDDAAKLLHMLYNGRKPRRVHTLLCVCGARADLRESPRAWNGWQILPHAVCPRCIERGKALPAQEPYPAQARARFMEMVHQQTGLSAVSAQAGEEVTYEKPRFAPHHFTQL